MKTQHPDLSIKDAFSYWLMTACDSAGPSETISGGVSCCAHVMIIWGPCWDSFDYMEIIIHMSRLMVYADGGWGQNTRSLVYNWGHVFSHNTSKEYEMRGGAAPGETN